MVSLYSLGSEDEHARTEEEARGNGTENDALLDGVDGDGVGGIVLKYDLVFLDPCDGGRLHFDVLDIDIPSL